MNYKIKKFQDRIINNTIKSYLINVIYTYNKLQIL